MKIVTRVTWNVHFNVLTSTILTYLKVSFNEMSVQIKKSSKLKDSSNWMGEMVREVLEKSTFTREKRPC